MGEDITHNAGTVRGLPGHVPWPHEVEVRGEVYITHADFEEVGLHGTIERCPPTQRSWCNMSDNPA